MNTMYYDTMPDFFGMQDLPTRAENSLRRKRREEMRAYIDYRVSQGSRIIEDMDSCKGCKHVTFAPKETVLCNMEVCTKKVAG